MEHCFLRDLLVLDQDPTLLLNWHHSIHSLSTISASLTPPPLDPSYSPGSIDSCIGGD